MSLTPAELVHLISAHTRIYPDPNDPWDNSPVAEESRQKFLEMGVIFRDLSGHYLTTAIGKRWVERILATPDPLEWEILKTQSSEGSSR